MTMVLTSSEICAQDVSTYFANKTMFNQQVSDGTITLLGANQKPIWDDSENGVRFYAASDDSNTNAIGIAASSTTGPFKNVSEDTGFTISFEAKWLEPDNVQDCRFFDATLYPSDIVGEQRTIQNRWKLFLFRPADMIGFYPTYNSAANTHAIVSKKYGINNEWASYLITIKLDGSVIVIVNGEIQDSPLVPSGMNETYPSAQSMVSDILQHIKTFELTVGGFTNLNSRGQYNGWMRNLQIISSWKTCQTSADDNLSGKITANSTMLTNESRYLVQGSKVTLSNLQSYNIDWSKVEVYNNTAGTTISLNSSDHSFTIPSDCNKITIRVKSGSTPSDVIKAKTLGTISWLTPGPASSVSKTVADDNFSYTATLSGTGNVTQKGSIQYTSSNPEIATVATDGSVNLVGNTGDVTITASAIDGTDYYYTNTLNYTINVTKKDLSSSDIIATVPSAVRNYTGSAYTPEVTVNNNSKYSTLMEKDTDYSVEYSNNTNAGTATITLTGMGKYTGTKTIDFIINKESVTVKADDKTATYGDIPSYTVTYNGFVNNETSSVVTGTPLYECSYQQYSDVGTYTISPMVTTLSATNYNFTSVTGTLTVTPKDVTVSGITVASKVYDGTKAATVNTGAATLTGKVDGDELTVSASGNTFDSKDVGSRTVNLGTLTLGGGKAGNYQLAASGQQQTASAEITAKPLTITANNKTRAYGVDNPELTVSYDGFIDGEGQNHYLSSQ